MKNTILSLVLIVNYGMIYSQNTFEKTYGGIGWESFSACQQTTDSGFIAAGSIYTPSSPATSTDIYLLRTDKFGDTLWTKRIGSLYNESANSIEITYDGGYIIGGKTVDFDGTETIYLVRTDSEGDTIWTKTSDPNTEYTGITLAKTLDSGFVIAFNRRDVILIYPFPDIWLIHLMKFDDSGNLQWSKIDTAYSFAAAHDVIQTNDCGYLIAGNIQFPYSQWTYKNNLGYLIKTNEQGDTLWTKTYSEYENSSFRTAIQTLEGDFVIAGGSYTSMGHLRLYVVKTDSNGNVIWSRCYESESEDVNPNSIALTDDGCYIITGALGSAASYDNRVYLAKIGFDGEMLWKKIYGGIHEQGSSVLQTMDRGFIVAGTAMVAGLNYQGLFIKTDSLGNSSGTLGFNKKLFEMESDMKIYPNPTKGRIEVSIPVEYGGIRSIEIFNYLGKLVKITYDITDVDLGALQDGIYFLVATSEKSYKLRCSAILNK